MSLSITNFQKQITTALAMIDRKVTYLYKNLNSGDRNFGFHNTDPQFTVDVTGTINTSEDYYRKGYPLMPAGTLIQFAGVDVPNGWLLCDGSTLLISNYQELFNMIKNTYGGDGVINFNLPNFSGRVPLGSGLNYQVGDKGGSTTHTLTLDELPIHTHNSTMSIDGAHSHSASSATSGLHNHTGTTSLNGSHTHTTNTTGTTYGLIPLGVGSTTTTGVDDDGSGEPNVLNSPLTLTINSSGDHTHSISTDGNHSHSITVDEIVGHNHTLTINNTGGGQAHNIMQPYLVIHYLIKY
jgi:microcystin-dependent protein